MYYWKQDEFPEKNFDRFKHYGFIAQEVEKIIPDVVGTDDNGWKAVRYTGFTPLLVEAVKEQQEQISKNEGRLETLESQYSELKDDLTRQSEDLKRQSVMIDLLLKRNTELEKDFSDFEKEKMKRLLRDRGLLEAGEEGRQGRRKLVNANSDEWMITRVFKWIASWDWDSWDSNFTVGLALYTGFMLICFYAFVVMFYEPNDGSFRSIL